MIVKAPGADEVIARIESLDPVLASYYRVMRLKRLFRQGWLKRGVSERTCESVAEHSFGVALLALLCAPPGAGPLEEALRGRGAAAPEAPQEARQEAAPPESPPEPPPAFDRLRALLIALVHELGETYAGDITPVDGVAPEEKSRRERAALLRALEGHPDRGFFLGLWEEFEEGSSAEARWVRELDRLEMGLEAALIRAEGSPLMEEFFESARRTVKEPALRALLEEAVEASAP